MQRAGEVSAIEVDGKARVQCDMNRWPARIYDSERVLAARLCRASRGTEGHRDVREVCKLTLLQELGCITDKR